MRWFRRSGELRTERLVMEATTVEMMTAESARDYVALGRLLRARVTAEWPPEHWEPHVFEFITKQLTEQPETVGWHRYVLARDGWWGRVLVGCVGAFPKAEGDVEIGYSTLPEYQRRGFAVEATQALVEMLFRDAEVRSVSAQTYPSLPESVKVMERCGMRFVGSGDDEGTVRYRRGRGTGSREQGTGNRNR